MSVVTAIIWPAQGPLSETFEEQAPRVLRQLRSALSGLIEAVPSAAAIRKATDLERALDIPTTLAWKVFTFTHAGDPMAQVGNIPGGEGMKKFFEAAGRAGAKASVLKAARAAFAEFDDLVQDHAGSRTALDSMVSGLEDEGSDHMDLQQKRAAFKAYSHIWGIQAAAQLSCAIYHPGLNDQFDAVSIRGLIGLRRLRRSASWVVSQVRVSDTDGVVRRKSIREPLDASGEAAPGVALLRQFCTQPIPRFRSVPAGAGIVNVELEEASVGSKSAMTCLLGDVIRAGGSRYRDEHNWLQMNQTAVRTPCQVLIKDVLVYAGTKGGGMYGPIQPDVVVYGDHRGGDPAPLARACDRLPLRESVAYLGKGTSVLRTPDVPRYMEMAQYAFDQMNWSAEEFDVYRCRVEYPVMPSSVVVQFDLPEKPTT